MHLELTYEASTGVALEYWEITEFAVNFPQRQLTVALGAWISKDAHDNGKDPCFNLVQEFSDKMSNDVYREFENKIVRLRELRLDVAEAQAEQIALMNAVEFRFGYFSDVYEIYEMLLGLPFFKNANLIQDEADIED